jgi:tetratricopeptide (TPR) repeat protein
MLQRRMPVVAFISVALCSATMAAAAAEMASYDDRAVETPYATLTTLPAGQCVEYIVRETGVDAVLKITDGETKVRSADADIGRFGVGRALYCTDIEKTLEIALEAQWPGEHASVRLSRRISQTPSSSLREFARVLIHAANSPAPADLAQRMEVAAKALSAAGDRERAALAWFMTMQAAGYALDAARTRKAFAQAYPLYADASSRRARVVLLNDYALQLSGSDATEAVRAIDEAFALQGALGDAKLAAAIQNNRCLIHGDAGHLIDAEACYGRVLAQHLRIGSGKAAIGAARNNLGLARLNLGRYREAREDFRRAVDERREGGDEPGNIVSLGNLALADYQLGDVGASLRTLHAGYREAEARDNRLGRALMAGYLASVYAAWGDSNSAYAFSTIEEGIYRDAGRRLDRSRALRVQARIALQRGRIEEARRTIDEAWRIAVEMQSKDSMANIAPVYGDVLIESGDPAAAEAFLRQARNAVADRFPAADLQSVNLTLARALRVAGHTGQARKMLRSLQRAATFPGMLRSRVRIEQALIDVADTGTDADVVRRRYSDTLQALCIDVHAARDPDLALRLRDLVRPLAEAMLERESAPCGDDACATAALAIAQAFFAVTGDIEPIVADGDADELAALLQALSQIEARGAPRKGTDELRQRAKRLQSGLRLAEESPTRSDCRSRGAAGMPTSDVVYFFGERSGRRWQRTGDAWSITRLPPWRSIAAALASADAADGALPALTEGLRLDGIESLDIGGDSRIARIPFAGLELADGSVLVDHADVTLRFDVAAEAVRADDGVRFLAASSDAELPLSAREKTELERWAKRYALTSGADGAPLRFLHVVAHGQADAGGLAVVWAQGRPLVGFVDDARRKAQTVLLNACESTASPQGDPEQASVAFGFLRGGASDVVGTLYPVPDAVAYRFAELFYASFDPKLGNTAAATRTALLALRRNPYAGNHWKAYTVMARTDR